MGLGGIRLESLQQEVIEYLTKWNNVYTKTMYRALKVKDRGVTLNVFRGMLRYLEKQGTIKQEGNILPYWNIIKEK